MAEPFAARDARSRKILQIRQSTRTTADAIDEAPAHRSDDPAPTPDQNAAERRNIAAEHRERIAPPLPARGAAPLPAL
ncbi:hypothetical protein [Pseudogemmobacter humi]|uniref:hypothetical protein n=1 Tax=Pseudogemmobacter humi TaxID=2483812 RepID=UPI00135A3549|nr:hypothetical protein [Pseudogemmobacter humi]